jgi:hypothetical protein
MSASDEWTEYHLTPAGWVEGSSQRDFARVKRVTEPVDRALTVVYRELAESYSPFYPSQNETWRSSDSQLVATLLEKHGPAPKEL